MPRKMSRKRIVMICAAITMAVIHVMVIVFGILHAQQDGSTTMELSCNYVTMGIACLLVVPPILFLLETLVLLPCENSSSGDCVTLRTNVSAVAVATTYWAPLTISHIDGSSSNTNVAAVLAFAGIVVGIGTAGTVSVISKHQQTASPTLVCMCLSLLLTSLARGALHDRFFKIRKRSRVPSR
jgi:hypothetical protein